VLDRRFIDWAGKAVFRDGQFLDHQIEIDWDWSVCHEQLELARLK
jgi:hypothetical protein